MRDPNRISDLGYFRREIETPANARLDMSDKRYNAISKAQNLGTYNALDRSQQYQGVETPELLRSLNEAWTKIRNLEREGCTKDSEILSLKHSVTSYKVANIALTSIITGLAWEGIKYVLPLLASLIR